MWLPKLLGALALLLVGCVWNYLLFVGSAQMEIV
jgi:hypothetical protein